VKPWIVGDFSRLQKDPIRELIIEFLAPPRELSSEIPVATWKSHPDMAIADSREFLRLIHQRANERWWLNVLIYRPLIRHPDTGAVVRLGDRLYVESDSDDSEIELDVSLDFVNPLWKLQLSETNIRGRLLEYKIFDDKVEVIRYAARIPVSSTLEAYDCKYSNWTVLQHVLSFLGGPPKLGTDPCECRSSKWFRSPQKKV